MSIDFSIVEPDSTTSNEDVTAAVNVEPVSWEIMNNNNAIDTGGDDMSVKTSEKMDNLTVEFVQEPDSNSIDTSSIDVGEESGLVRLIKNKLIIIVVNEQVEDVLDQTIVEAQKEPQVQSNHQKLCEHARSTWRRLVDECCLTIRQAVDLLGSVSEATLREVLEDQKGEAYLSDVCVLYLAAFRFNTALAQFHMANRAVDLAALWAELQVI